MKAKCFVVVFLLCMLPSALALGISPAKMDVEFTPGIEKEFAVNIINNEAKSLDVAVYAEGPLSSFVRFPASTVHLNPGEYSKPLSFSLNFPEKVDRPGLHEVLITVKEIQKDVKDETISIGSSLSVISVLRINVPYPGKYAAANMFISEAEPGKEMVFAVEIDNLGTQDIQSAKASVSIISSGGERVAVINTDEKAVPSMIKRELVAKWVQVDTGNYKAVAILYYDGNQTSVTKDFSVGNFFLRLLSITVKNFKLGGIAKFDILTQNIGNEVAAQVFSKMILDEGNRRLMDVESNRVDLASREAKVMNAYWDTDGVAKGTYFGLIRMVYSDKSSEKKVKMTVEDDGIRTEIITGMVVAPQASGIKSSSVVSVVVIFSLAVGSFIFFYIRRRVQNREKQNVYK